MKNRFAYSEQQVGRERPRGELPFTRAWAQRRIGHLQVALVCMVLVLMVASPARSEVFLALDNGGAARLVNPHAFNESLVSERFFPTIEGWQLVAEAVAGGARLADGRLVTAMLNKADYDGSNLQHGWKLYEYHHEDRTWSVMTPLDGALSAIAVGPGGRLVGITFDPARFVKIDVNHGGFEDLGTFTLDQSSIPDFRVDQAALWYETSRNRFLYAHFNVEIEFEIWRIAADGESFGVLDSDVFQFSGPTDFVGSEAGLLMVVHDRVLRLDSKDNSVDVIPSDVGGGDTVPEYTRFLKSVPLGSVRASGMAAMLPLSDVLSCEPSNATLCLRKGDFRVTAEWTDPFTDAVKPAGVVQQSSDSGVLWFLEPSNQEALIKVLDACALNGHYWLFGSASTNLAYTVKVEELASGTVREYSNPAGTSAPAVTDTSAFPCSP